jgi:hypothetical protein
MRDRDQILAEIFDRLIKQDGGKIPSEVGELFSLGVRLHNECPDIDPGFKETLGRRLKREWHARVAARPRAGLPGLLAAVRSFRPRLALRSLATVVLILCLALQSAALFSPLRSTVEAGLSRVITLFGGAVVEQRSRSISTPPATEELGEFVTIEGAEAAGFALRAPAYLPDGFALQRVKVVREQGQQRALLSYANSGQDPPYGERGLAASESSTRTILIQQIVTEQTPEGAALALEVGPDSTEPLQVAGRPALWVAGRWSAAGRWERKGQEGLLILQDGDLLLMVSSGLGREESVRIAESMLR